MAMNKLVSVIIAVVAVGVAVWWWYPSGTDKTLDCLSASSRQEIANLDTCEVSAVVNCCCEEFNALKRVKGDVRVRNDVTHLRFGEVEEIEGDVVASRKSSGVLEWIGLGGVVFRKSRSVLASIDFGGVMRIGGRVMVDEHRVTSVNFGNLTSVGGKLDLSRNALTEVDLGNLTSVGGNLDLSCNALTSVDFGNLRIVDGYLDFLHNKFTRLDCQNLGPSSGIYIEDDVQLTNCRHLTRWKTVFVGLGVVLIVLLFAALTPRSELSSPNP